MQEYKTKIFNKRVITIITVLCYILAMLFFEIGYCNTNLVTNIIQKTGESIQYNFSLCRIVIYAAFLIIYFIFKNKFIDEAIQVLKNKYKRILIYILTIITILILIAGVFYILKVRTDITRAMSIILISILMFYIFMLYISNNHIKNIIVVTLTLGIIFSICVKFNHAIDEKKHFMTAFNMANLNFNYQTEPITDESVANIPHFTRYTEIDEWLYNKYEPEITNNVDTNDVPSTPTNYNFILYIFPATGIFIAKLLGGSVMDMYILGRIFNLLSYAILTCIAIKIIPFKKNIFFTVFVMPMMLLFATTYSVDGICIGLVSIFIAYCLKIYKESKTISLKQFIILVALFAIMLLAKSMAYILVAFMALILPIWNTLKKNKKYLPIIIGVSIIILIIGIFGVLYIKQTKLVEDVRAVGEISVSGQINHMLQNPIHDVKLAINHTLDTLLNYNWLVALHSNAFFGNTSSYLFLALMIFILFVAFTEDDHNFKLKDKIILIISFLMVFAMTSIALYLAFTQIGADKIQGYQTRYIVPILPLVLFTLSSYKFKTVKEKILNRNMNIAIISGVFIFISIIQVIFMV